MQEHQEWVQCNNDKNHEKGKFNVTMHVCMAVKVWKAYIYKYIYSLPHLIKILIHKATCHQYGHHKYNNVLNS